MLYSKPLEMKRGCIILLNNIFNNFVVLVSMRFILLITTVYTS
jgi:hypothetical protein